MSGISGAFPFRIIDIFYRSTIVAFVKIKVIAGALSDFSFYAFPVSLLQIISVGVEIVRHNYVID
jgi:uncharacterized paraquat-inducible protein A